MQKVAPLRKVQTSQRSYLQSDNKVITMKLDTTKIIERNLGKVKTQFLLLGSPTPARQRSKGSRVGSVVLDPTTPVSLELGPRYAIYIFILEQ